MANNDAARAIADVSAGVILATVTIAAPPERVFRAITEPGEIVRWWGSDELYRTTSHTADLRPGGAWRSEGKGSDGTPFVVEGEFVRISDEELRAAVDRMTRIALDTATAGRDGH
jgi:uncharacterized protein YndB with AHSA1/START domain